MKNNGKNMDQKRWAISTIVILLIFLLDCSTRSVRYLAPHEVNELTEKTSIVVELNDGSVVIMKQPRIKDGKLIYLSERNAMHNSIMETKEIDIAKIKLLKVVKKGNFLLSFIPAAIAAALLINGVNTAPEPPPSESCPFVYSWDGTQYVFESEPYGGAICRGLQRSEWCRLDWLRSADHLYRIRIANELDETQYTDEAKLLVIDHKAGSRIVADTSGGLHAFSACQPPGDARDENGRDIRSLVAAKDLSFWESGGDFAALGQKTDMRHELTFTFPKPVGARQAKLLANAWTSPWGAEVPKMFLQALGRDLGNFYMEVNALGPAWQKVMSWFLTEELYLLRIQVNTSHGWRTSGYIQGGGPFMANDKAYLLDISDVPGNTLELKLRPPVTFWRINYLAVDYSPEQALQVRELAPARAIDEDGSDVTHKLEATDGDYLLAPRSGDSTDIYFNEPPSEQGLERSFILKVNGYYDIHLPSDHAPRHDLVDRFFGEPGFTIRYALDAFLERQKQNR